MVRGFSVVLALTFALSGCESWSLGQWQKVSERSESAPAKWVYVPSTGEVVPNAYVPPQPVAQPAPAPAPAPVASVPEPTPQPVDQPAAVTSGGQSGEPKVISCTIC